MFFTSLKIAYQALRLHKSRSFLTVLGLTIGISSIIIVMNMGQSLSGFILKQLEVFGADYVEVEIKVPSTSKTSSENAMGMAQGVSVTTLKIKDAEAIAKHPNIKDYYCGILGQKVVSFQGEQKTSVLWGVSASFFSLFKAKVEEGRPFSEEDDKNQAPVVVLGHELKNKLFGDSEAVGQMVKIGNKSFRVAGVMEKQGMSFFFDMDSVVFLPIRTLQKRILGIDHLQFIIAYLRNPALAQATALDLNDIMRAQHDITDPNKDDFAVTTMEEAMGILDTITGGITLLLIAIAAISLLVGGIGIMNIMYVSVSERTYEIGLRKAVGATNRNILWQFLWEAICLTFAGGVIGVATGELLSIVSSLAASASGFNLGVSTSFSGLLIGTGFSVLVGLIFGLYPARKAAQLQPVEALSQKQ